MMTATLSLMSIGNSSVLNSAKGSISLVDIYEPPVDVQSQGIRFENQQFLYVENFLKTASATCLLDHCLRDINWYQETVTMFGSKYRAPRLTAWYGNSGCSYHYSGTSRPGEPWTDCLAGTCALIKRQLRHPFNFMLANRYRSGSDHVGWHSDNERDMGVRPVIASLSLGASRVFRVRPRRGGKSNGWLLQHGSLLVMWGDSQRLFKHSVPRTAQPGGERVNLTFRYVSK